MAIFGVLAPLLGILIVTRHPRHLIGWLLCLVGLIFGTLQLCGELTVYTNFTRPDIAGRLWVGWVMNWFWTIAINTVLLIIALFPNGQLPKGRRRWLIRLILLSFGLMCGSSVIEHPMHSAYVLDNPLTQPPSAALFNIIFSLGTTGFALAACGVAWQTIVQFRRSQGDERQQYKWLVATTILATLLILIGLILGFGFDSTLGQVMVSISVGFPIVGIGLAVLRYRLYDIDIIIRRSLIYTFVSALLALIYFGSVIVLQNLLQASTDQGSALAIVISTLLIAALFNPLRERTQLAIDRRFYRRRYDAEQVLAAFARAARDEVDLERLTITLQQVVRETMEPTSVSLWLKPREEIRNT
jgi:hypothetical protein